MNLTELKIRKFCDEHTERTKPIISSDMMGMKSIANLLKNGYSIEQILFTQVKQWGLRHIFDAYCAEYRWNNIHLKIHTIQLICQNLSCDFSDIIRAFAKENITPSCHYRIGGATGFFNEIFELVADGSILKDKSINHQLLSQIINFAKYRRWEKWAPSMKTNHYSLIELYFCNIYFYYFIRNRPLPSIGQ